MVRAYDPFCERGVLATINELADFSHSKAMADLVAEGKWKTELLITLGKVAPPRYAHFIGRYKDDSEESVRRAVAVALGLIDNDAITVPVLIQLLSRGDAKTDFLVRWEAAGSLAKVSGRKGTESVRRRLLDLLQERDAVTVVLAAGALAAVGDARGAAKLRDLASHADPQVRQEAVLALANARDRGSREVVARRLKDESLAVRAAAVYMLGLLGDPSLIPALRTAVEESIEYEKELQRRKERGESDAVLSERYGVGMFDLRQTLEQAIEMAQKPGAR
jgi:HEAT repeat protein